MTTKDSIIGQSIICAGMGIGEIVDITSLQEGGEDFYKVIFTKDKCINYFSVKNQNNFRIISTEAVVRDAINIFKSSFKKLKYDSIQQQIFTQKEMLKEDDLCKLAKALSILKGANERHAQINKPFNDSIKSFVDEIIFVLKTDQAEAYSLLGLSEPSSKKKK